MKCSEIQYLIPDYIKASLTEDESALVKDHLNECAMCKNDAEEMKLIFKQLVSEEHLSLEPSYFVNLVPRIHQRIEQRKTSLFYFALTRYVLPVSGLLFFVIMFVKVFLPSNENDHESLQTLLLNVPFEEIQVELDRHLELFSSSEFDNSIIFEEDQQIVKEILATENNGFSLVEYPYEELSSEDMDMLVDILKRMDEVDN